MIFYLLQKQYRPHWYSWIEFSFFGWTIPLTLHIKAHWLKYDNHKSHANTALAIALDLISDVRALLSETH